MQPAAHDVVWNLTVPASAATDDGKDEPRHGLRRRAGDRHADGEGEWNENEKSSGCRPVAAHRLRFALEGAERNRVRRLHRHSGAGG
jgi:hypothetical protein